MGRVMHSHRSPRSGFTRPRQVLVRGQHPTIRLWMCIDKEAEGSWGRGGPHHCGKENCTYRIPLYPVLTYYGSVALGGTFHSEHNGAWWTGMEEYHTTTIQHQTSIPTSTLQCMRFWFIDIICIIMQEGRPCIISTQWATWRDCGPGHQVPHNHRWELPVIHYHKIMVTYPYPFFVVITQLSY